jgi:hypothetical protein
MLSSEQNRTDKKKRKKEKKRGERRRAKPRACSTFFDIKGAADKEFILKGQKQSISHTTVAFYGNCVKMCKGFALIFDDKKLAVAS